MSDAGEDKPRIFNIFRGEALQVRETDFGRVGTIYSGEGVEIVWVSKHGEAIDPDWFSQGTVDILLVVQGRLMVEFERSEFESRVMEKGELLVLPANTRCRAYRWPRDDEHGTIFVAFYPTQGERSQPA